MLYRVWFAMDTGGCWLHWSVNPRQHCTAFAVLWIPIPILRLAQSEVHTLCSCTWSDLCTSPQGVIKWVKLYWSFSRCTLRVWWHFKHGTAPVQHRACSRMKHAASVLHLCCTCGFCVPQLEWGQCWHCSPQMQQELSGSAGSVCCNYSQRTTHPSRPPPERRFFSSITNWRAPKKFFNSPLISPKSAVSS